MKIVFDVDNVLCSTIIEWLPHFNAKFRCHVEYDNIKEYDLSQIKVGENPRQHLINFCGENLGSFSANGVSFIRSLSDIHHLFVATDRQVAYKDKTITWLKDNYGNSFQDVLFTKELKTTKSELVRKIAADLVVEDDPFNIISIAQLRVLALVMDHPWNKNIPENKKIRRIFSLYDVESYSF